MQISCPKCARSYTLDERLLPPTGAPVQCTQCGMVFTALPTPVAVAEAPGTDAARHTQLFGATVAKPAPVAPVGPVMQTEPGRHTQMFGAVAAPPVVNGTSAEPGRHTQMFGAVPSAPTKGGAAIEPGRHTQMFGAVPVAPVVAAAPDPGRQTQMFGRVPTPAAVPVRRTPPYGSPAVSAMPPPSAAPEAPPPNRTQIFGRSAPPPRELTLSQELDLMDQARSPDASVDLPPEPPELLVQSEAPDEAVQYVLRAEARSRTRWLALGMAFLVLGAGALGARWTLSRAKDLPLDVVTAKEASFDLLRRDDAQSRARAAEQLKRLVEAHPEALEIRADELLALSLELDERKLRIEHLRGEADAQGATIIRLQEHQTPADWRSRVEEHRRELESIKKLNDPLVVQAESLDTEVNASFKVVTESAPDEATVPLGVLRAQMIYFGVKGSDQAIALAERYRRHGGQDGWDALAMAEYALNARVAPDTLREALQSVERLKEQDSGLIRAYLLSARLKRGLQDAAGAGLELEAAAALNPRHETARELLAWQRAAEAGSLSH